MKSCFLTQSYKQGFIHSYYESNNEVIKVQVDKYAYIIQVKSIRAAKLLITKNYKNYGGIKK